MPHTADTAASETRSAREPGGHRDAAWRAAPYVAAGVAFGLAFIAVYVVAVRTEPGQRIENLALLGAAVRSEADRGLSIGTLAPISVITFAVAMLAAALVGFARRRLGLGILVAGLMFGAVFAAEVLKEVLDRPALVSGPGWLLRNSFPSGTAAVAAALAIGALIVSPDRLRWVALVFGAVTVGVVAQATQVAGWHRLSDVVGSALLVAAIGCFGVGALAAVDFVAPSRVGRVHPRVYAAILVAALVAFALGGLLLALLVVFPLLSSPEGGRRVFLQTAFPLFAAALTGLTVTLFARLIEPISLGRRRPPSEPKPPVPPEDRPAAVRAP
jgi:membrane-associated phospholipid phosphatase